MIIEKKSKKIVQEKVVEKEAPKRQEIVIEEVPEVKNMTVVVKPQTVYTVHCDCGCKCHRVAKSYTTSVRKEMTEQVHQHQPIH